MRWPRSNLWETIAKPRARKRKPRSTTPVIGYRVYQMTRSSSLAAAGSLTLNYPTVCRESLIGLGNDDILIDCQCGEFVCAYKYNNNIASEWCVWTMAIQVSWCCFQLDRQSCERLFKLELNISMCDSQRKRERERERDTEQRQQQVADRDKLLLVRVRLTSKSCGSI